MVYGSCLKAISRFLLCLLIVSPSANGDSGKDALFVTWEGFETDKCASIWLIRRFIAPAAEIRFYPRGTQFTEGIAFDTPDAQLRRYHNKSTFETLLERYALEDVKLIYLGRIIHDIEVNTWERKVMAETPQVENDMQALIAQEDTQRILEGCQAYFEQLYQTGIGSAKPVTP